MECSLCRLPLDEDEDWFFGFSIGILPYNLCHLCFNGLDEMFAYLQDDDDG